MVGRRTIVITTCVLAVATFSVVQDRVTAAGARRYAAIARQAVASGNRPPSIEEVMTPAIRASVGWGSAGAVAVLVVGLAVSRLRQPTPG